MSEKSESSATSARNARIDATAREMFVMWCSRVNGPPSEGYTRVIAQNAYAFATALEGARANVIGASAHADDEKRTREIDRVICDHGHVSDQVRDLQRAVLRVCEMLDVLVDVTQLDRPHDVFDPIRHLVAHEVGRHSGDPITWVPKRESPFRAEDER